LMCLEKHTDQVRSVTFLHDGKRALSAGFDQSVRLWDLERGDELKRIPYPGQVLSVLPLGDDKTFLAAGKDKCARLFELSSGRQMTLLQGHTAEVSSLALVPGHERCVTGSFDGTARLWDLLGKQVRQFGPVQPIHCLAVTPDGQT